jgi:hypothetical protein
VAFISRIEDREVVKLRQKVQVVHDDRCKNFKIKSGKPELEAHGGHVVY